MKKTYIAPITETTYTEPQPLMAGSVQGLMDDRLEIGYGGIDENGSIDPSANGMRWDDENWDKL